MKRTKLYETIVQRVLDGEYPSYEKSINGDKAWTLYKGNKQYYSWDKEVSCVSFVLHNSGYGVSQSTLVSAQFNVEEIAETLYQHELHVRDTADLRASTTEFLTKPENKWWRK